MMRKVPRWQILATGLALTLGITLPLTAAASPRAHITAARTVSAPTTATDAGATQSVISRFMTAYERSRAEGVGATACVYGALFGKGPNAGARWTKVLDVANWGTSNRSMIHMWAYRTTGNVENQRWFMCSTGGTWNGSPIVTIENSNAGGMCLDKSEDHLDGNGTAVYIHQCSGTANQTWALVQRGDGFYELRNMVSDDGVSRYLDISSYQWADGAQPIWMWERTGAWNQAWE
jgi:hypothetical protein